MTPDSHFKGGCRERLGPVGVEYFAIRKYNIGFLVGPLSDQITLSNHLLATQLCYRWTDRQLYYVKDDLDTARFRACISCKNVYPNGNSMHFSANL